MEKKKNSQRVREAIAFLDNVLKIMEESDKDSQYTDSYELQDKYMRLGKELAETITKIPDIDEEMMNFQHLYFVTDVVAMLLLTEHKKRAALLDELIQQSNGNLS